MNVRNPFEDTKIEYESDPILWFSTRSRRIAQRGKSTFVNGTRGSGKTSILRSLSTWYISQIPSLRDQMAERRLDWFGVYIRLQDSFADVLSAKAADREDVKPRASREQLSFSVFAQYVELLMLSALTKELSDLREEGFLKFSLGAEYDAANRLLSDVRVLNFYANGELIETFGQLSRLCNRVLADLFEAAITNESRIPHGVYQPSMPGEIIAAAAKFILPVIRGDRFVQGQKLRLKLMMDDCEILPLEHQIYLNTLIRNTTAPISWVIAHIGNLYDSRTTLRKNQMLSDADREIEALDEVPEAEFKTLCGRIASLRLYQAMSPAARRKADVVNPNDCFNLSQRLGRVTLNELVRTSLDRSISADHERLTASATAWKELFARANLSPIDRANLELTESAPPYTIAVTAEHLGISLEAAERDLYDERARRRLGQKLARKQRGAFLLIGKELKLKMNLAGEGIVIALSDSCIRDFLDIMREIFKRDVGDDSTENRLVRFVRSDRPIPIATQSAAIYAASEAKLKGVMTIADPYGVGVTRLVEALGLLTTQLQTGPRAIQNPEIGKFRLHWPRLRDLLVQLNHDGHELDELFRKSELDGFVREVDQRDMVIMRPVPRLAEHRMFRLHRRFAPHYGFSFRGPYAEFPLPESAFLELLVADSGFVLSDWVRRTLRSNEAQVTSPDQLSLPGVDDELDD